MHSGVSVNRLWCLPFALALVGCVKHYVQPAPGEAHATLKFRRIYQETSGARLKEKLDLDERRAFDIEGDSAEGETPRTDAITIFPGFHSVEVAAEFSSSMSTEGTTYEFSHGECKGTLALNTVEGGTYLIQLDYRSSDFCTVECYRQIPKGDGEFESERCP